MNPRQGGLSITPFGLAFYELVIGSKHSELIFLNPNQGGEKAY
jgi:hypothetical protein